MRGASRGAAGGAARWVIDDFDVRRPLGRGRFGNVYLARQKDGGHKVALKVLLKAQIKQDGCVLCLRVGGTGCMYMVYVCAWEGKGLWCVM